MKDIEDTKVRVKRIYKEDFNGKVFNFHCLPNENYFSHNILVHNCYKSNGGDQPTHNMTFNEFKIIFSKLTEPPILTQIAFGIMNISTNPDFFKMMGYAKENGVIPNYTCHGLDVTPEIAEFTAKTCGSVAVSIVNKEKTYDSVKMFTDAGMKQTNMHFMLSEETYDKAFEIIEDISTDPRLSNLNAIVFLQYKAKGRNPDAFNSVNSPEAYRKLFNFCEEKKVTCGFDSCSGPCFLKSIEGIDNEDLLKMMVEPCESGLFSSYINCYGKFFPCSFCEGENEWSNEEGIDVLHCENFIKDIWNSPKVIKWREELISNKRNCPVFDLMVV